MPTIKPGPRWAVLLILVAGAAGNPARAQTMLPHTSLEAYVLELKAALPKSGSEAFVPASAEEVLEFSRLAESLLRGTPPVTEPGNFNYSLELLYDRPQSQSYWVLQEKSIGRRGLGTFIIALTYARNLILEVPHPLYDLQTLEESRRIFQETAARALFVAGTHRCANSIPSPCSGTTTACGSPAAPYRNSDSAHFDGNFMHAVHQAATRLQPAPLILNMHGQSSEPYAAILSDGTRLSAEASAPVSHLRSALRARGMNAVSCNIAADNPSQLSLCGTDNVQGRLSNLSTDPCRQAAVLSTRQFLHIEQELALRQNPEPLIEALKATVEQLPLPVARLERVLANLSSPVLATHAGDGSHRLFIVERDGRIRVLQPGGSAPQTFLDITGRIRAGGEQGLLGLAFHPQFKANRRFFINYTRQPDGATVVAERLASAAEPNRAEEGEKVLLTIAQPYANHNGGMIAFGPDGLLYIGMGDGGSANDPQNRAQDPEQLLGKMLRIDIDRSEGNLSYAIPRDNPLAGTVPGRDEIYAMGLRNPWRFSFDRATGELYAGDVGQDQIEEIDLIQRGGNYGWRIYEGTRCTQLGPAPCNAAEYAPPVLEYTHSGGRCSVTGGYAYRGARSTLPVGAYLFADYCTGEIFVWHAGQQRKLLDTHIAITSFGEDETGELYITGIDGTVDRLVSNGSLAGLLYFPRLISRDPDGTPGDSGEYTGLALANPGLLPAAVTLTAFDREGALLSGAGLQNPVSLMLPGQSQMARIDFELFGTALTGSGRSGWIRLESDRPELLGFFLAFNGAASVLDGAAASSKPTTGFILPELEPVGTTRLHIANPNSEGAVLSMELTGANGRPRAAAEVRSIPPRGALIGDLSEWFAVAPAAGDYLRVLANPGVVPFALLGVPHRHWRGLNGIDLSEAATRLYAPQFVTGGGTWRTTLSLVNMEDRPAAADLQLYREDGSAAGAARRLELPARGKALVDDPRFFGLPSGEQLAGYVTLTSTGARMAGSVTFGDERREACAATLPLLGSLQRNLFFSHIASDESYYTGLAVLNPGSDQALATLEVFAPDARRLGMVRLVVSGGRKLSRLLTELLPELAGQSLRAGSMKLTSDREIAAYAVFGTRNGTALSALPAAKPAQP